MALDLHWLPFLPWSTPCAGMKLPRGEALLLPDSKSLFSVPVGLNAMGCGCLPCAPPAEGPGVNPQSWALFPAQDRGSVEAAGGHRQLTLPGSVTPKAPAGSATIGTADRDLDKCGVFPNPLQCPSSDSAVVGDHQGPAQLNLSRSGQWVQSCSSQGTSHPRHFSCRECVWTQELVQP